MEMQNNVKMHLKEEQDECKEVSHQWACDSHSIDKKAESFINATYDFMTVGHLHCFDPSCLNQKWIKNPLIWRYSHLLEQLVDLLRIKTSWLHLGYILKYKQYQQNEEQGLSNSH